MARIAIDWTKVEMDGSVEPKDVFAQADERIQGIIAGGNAKGGVQRVALTVDEKQFGKAFLKLKEVKESALDGILAVLKTGGVDVVVDAYNDWMRAKTLGFLQREYGDLEQLIKDAVKVCVDSMEMDEAEAREFVISRRKAKGLRVPGETKAEIPADAISA